MGIGHIAAGIACKKLDRNVNAAWYVGAALLADVLLWGLILVGREQMIIPDDYEQIRYMRFVFPISHGILSGLGWAVALGIFSYVFIRRIQASVVIAIACFSHIFLDWIVHPTQFSVLNGITVPGLGLWNHVYLSVVVEFVLTCILLWLYLRSTEPGGQLGRYGMVGFVIALMALMFSGQLFAPKPQSIEQIAITSLATLAIIVAVVGWLDTKRT